jgi:multidrug efflux pump subunit AcrA (membrane-fusion protein)
MKSSKLVIGIAVLILGAALIAISMFKRPASGLSLPPTRVAAPSSAADASTSIKAIGTFVSANQATLAFQSAGRVKEIKVKEGENVKAGTQLATLDAGILDSQVTQAQANLRDAESRYRTFQVNTITQPRNNAVLLAPGLAATQPGATTAYFNQKTQLDLIRADRRQLESVLQRSRQGGFVADAFLTIGAVKVAPQLQAALADLSKIAVHIMRIIILSRRKSIN